MNCIKILTFTISLWLSYEKCAGVTCTGSWTQQGEHCYQQTVGVINTEADAKSKCTQLGSGAVPVTVHNNNDDKDLTDYLTAIHVTDTSFYIGLEFKSNEWEWLDGGNTKNPPFQEFDRTTDPSGVLPCAHINVVGGAKTGWITNNCKEQVQSLVCQMPSHSLEDMYQQLQALKAQIGKGTVPVGFIYVQLPGQKAPSAMWPKPIVWEDMTTTYAGLFFRAEGAGSAVFNTTGVTKQTASLFTTFNITAKGLSGVSYNPQLTQTRVTPIKEETLSGEIVPGDVVNSLKVLIDDRNAHPVNTAVRIWRRRA